MLGKPTPLRTQPPGLLARAIARARLIRRLRLYIAGIIAQLEQLILAWQTGTLPASPPQHPHVPAAPRPDVPAHARGTAPEWRPEFISAPPHPAPLAPIRDASRPGIPNVARRNGTRRNETGRNGTPAPMPPGADGAPQPLLVLGSGPDPPKSCFSPADHTRLGTPILLRDRN